MTREDVEHLAHDVSTSGDVGEALLSLLTRAETAERERDAVRTRALNEGVEEALGRVLIAISRSRLDIPMALKAHLGMEVATTVRKDIAAIRALSAAPDAEGGAPSNRDALRWAQALQTIQQAAAAALEKAPDNDLFAHLHRICAVALASDAEPANEAEPAAGLAEDAAKMGRE